ncbi:unnamed protein product [Nesidiocoris tenuis]|uniref:Uncharacterized protein n=1 Tax=Nesidiocoris tenuis TaxID=355587 RepID=A0A6H5G9V1_9HEMI|nr:unnamed protein product [Nesidiocoris tenuis]
MEDGVVMTPKADDVRLLRISGSRSWFLKGKRMNSSSDSDDLIKRSSCGSSSCDDNQGPVHVYAHTQHEMTDGQDREPHSPGSQSDVRFKVLIGKERGIPASDCGGSTSEEEIPEEVIPRVVKRKAIPGDLSRRTRFTSGARETSFRTIAGLYCSPVIPHERFRPPIRE